MLENPGSLRGDGPRAPPTRGRRSPAVRVGGRHAFRERRLAGARRRGRTVRPARGPSGAPRPHRNGVGQETSVKTRRSTRRRSSVSTPGLSVLAGTSAVTSWPRAASRRDVSIATRASRRARQETSCPPRRGCACRKRLSICLEDLGRMRLGAETLCGRTATLAHRPAAEPGLESTPQGLPATREVDSSGSTMPASASATTPAAPAILGGDHCHACGHGLDQRDSPRI